MNFKKGTGLALTSIISEDFITSLTYHEYTKLKK
jgi:hypothetical protein